MSGFNGIADLGWLGEDTAASGSGFSQSSNQSQSVSTQVSANATGGSISNSANVGSRIGSGKGGEIPWAWLIGAVALTGVAAYFFMGGGVRFQNPIQFNPPRSRWRKAKRNPPKRRRASRDDDQDEDEE